MTATTPEALSVALAYHHAWTDHDLDTAMGYVADDITCDAPGGQVTGAEQYRAFLSGFMNQLTGIDNVASFGDEDGAVLVYYPHTAATTSAATAEHFSVADGKITRSVLVFDRLSFAPPAT